MLVALLLVYTTFNFIDPSLTGNVVLETGNDDLFDFFENISGFSLENHVLTLALEETVIPQSLTTLNTTSVIQAYEHKLEDEEDDYDDRLEDIEILDNKKFTLDENKILNFTLNTSLENGDFITFHSENNADRELILCTQDGNCTISSYVFDEDEETYNFTLTHLQSPTNQFYLDNNKSVKINYLYGLKTHTYNWNVTSYAYPEQVSLISSEIPLPALSTLHNLLVNESTENQSILYEYSLNAQDWFVMTTPLDKETSSLWLRITFTSDGNVTPSIYDLNLNYSSCVADCFETVYVINRTAQISLLENSSAIINASFTQLNISSTSLEFNKTLSVLEYDATNVSYDKIPAGRFIEIEADFSENTSFVLRVGYDSDVIAASNINISSLAVYYYNTTSEDWEKLPSTVYTDENYVEAVLEHLSTYGLFGDTPSFEETSSGGSGGGGNSLPEVIEEFVVEEEIVVEEPEAVLPFTNEELVVEENAVEPEPVQEETFFDGLTGNVVDFGRDLFKGPNVILPASLILLAGIYLAYRLQSRRIRIPKRRWHR